MSSTFKTALIAAVVSAFFAAGAAVATTQTFVLGTIDRVNAASNVTNVQANGTTVNPVDAPLVTLENKSTTANATPLSLLAAPSHQPFKVNSQTKVVNLTADKLDGIDSKGFLARGADVLGSISLGSFAAHSCTDVTVSISGAQVGQVPLVAFRGSVPLPSGLMFQPLEVTSQGHVTSRVCNPTDTASIPASDIGFRLITMN
jgi:hypothetical protein